MTDRDAAYLNHLPDAISHIEDFSGTITSATELRDHPLERAGIERMLTIIGEAAKKHLTRAAGRISTGALEGDRRNAGQNYAPLFWRRLRSCV